MIDMQQIIQDRIHLTDLEFMIAHPDLTGAVMAISFLAMGLSIWYAHRRDRKRSVKRGDGAE